MQKYHNQAKTNIHIRKEIKEAKTSQKHLALKYLVNRKTVQKWQKRSCLEDKSSRPNKIQYALTEVEREIIRVIRSLTWWSVSLIVEALQGRIERINTSNVYRTIKSCGLNKPTEEKKREWKKFKEYLPGFIHIDVAYLPVLEGKRQYLFVAIDRATRLIYFEVYDSKSKDSAKDFLAKCRDFFPFRIDKLLTDNGGEFRADEFDKFCSALNIEHRFIKPNNPQTNGMVERVNDTIKSATVKSTRYGSLHEMKQDLLAFLKYYNLFRSHSSLKKNLKVKTPYAALWYWYNLLPNLFHLHPYKFHKQLLSLTL